MLSRAKLAPLPPSATNVQHHSWSGFGTGEEYAKFELSADDLGAFIANSPALKNAKMTTYTLTYQLMPYPKNPDEISHENDHFHLGQRNAPPWWDLTIKVRGSKYVLTYGPNAWLVINEETKTVFFRIVRG